MSDIAWVIFLHMIIILPMIYIYKKEETRLDEE